ncbi:AMP-binding protein, partial [Nostoc sp. NIES-2111]
MAEPPVVTDLLEGLPEAELGRTAMSALKGLRHETWSRRDLRDRARSVGVHLRDRLGLAEGDRVVLVARNSPSLVAFHLGTMLAGMIPVPLDAGSTADFVGTVTAMAEARAMVSSGLRDRPPHCKAIDIDTFAFGEPRPPIAQIGPDMMAEIVFTSGTTGRPKGVALTHANIMSNVRAASAVVPPDMPLRFVSLLPLSHMLEQTVGLFLPLMTGGEVHYSELQPLAILRE